MVLHKQIYYCEPVFRPPSEARSLLIQLTEGCTYKCAFCVSNLRKNFKIRDIEDVKIDLDIARKIYGPGVRRIFFLDGNAMVTPPEKLLTTINYAYELFPRLERCAVYAHAKDILKKAPNQLEELSKAGLRIAYVGFESGYNALLERIDKHATKQDYIKASKRLMEANIMLSATFINGLGGTNNHELSRTHAEESADLVNEICPMDERIWYIAFLSLMVPSGTEIFNQKIRGEFNEMNATEILEELLIFMENINFQNKNANCVFRSNHASNYLPIKGVLERDKQKIIKVIKKGISNPNILRPEFYRGL